MELRLGIRQTHFPEGMKHPFMTTEYLKTGIALNVQFKAGRPWVKKKFSDDNEMESWLKRKGFACYV